MQCYTKGAMKNTTQTESLAFPSEHWAVFNLHVNNAGKRAIRVTEREFGATNKKYIKLKNLFELHEIMAIFGEKPNRVTKFFAHMVYIFANGFDVAPRNTTGPTDDGIVYAEGKLPDNRLVTFFLNRDTGLVTVELTTNKGNGVTTLLKKQVYNGRQKAS